MRTTNPSYGLAAPLLLTFAFLAMAVPHALAQSSTTTYTVSGLVLSDAGAPLAGVNVDGYSYPSGGGETKIAPSPDDPARGASTVTGEDGRFKLSLPPGQAYVSVYYSEWRASDARDFELVGDMDLSFTLKTPPPKTAVVEGRVLDVSGNPVEGAEVRLDSACCYYYSEPAVMKSSDADATESSTEPAMEPATDPAAGSSSSGSAGVASPSIMPVDRCCCCPYDESLTYTTKADGVYRFTTYGGPRQLTASAKDFAQTTQQVELVDNQSVTADIVLEKVPARDASVKGRVTDATTGAPLANAQVNIRSLEWSRWAYNATQRDGSYQSLTVPGWAEITVSYYGYPEPIPLVAEGAADSSADSIVKPPEVQYYSYSKIVKLVSGDNPIDVTLEQRPRPSIALIGYVVDPDTKQAVPGATINVWNMDVSDWGSATTDATGSFRILVRPGHFQANAWKDGYLGGSQTFEVSEEPTQRVDVLLPKGTQKWAPCYEGDDCGGGIVYSREAISYDSGGGSAKGVAVPAMAPAPAGSDASSDAAEEGAASVTNARTAGFSEETGKTATYSGSGGNLPPYDPADTSTVPAAQNVPSEVPGLGVALLVGALAAVALLARRR